MIAMFLTSASNHSLTAILVSRFLINLQAVHQQQTDSESTQCSRATLVFERVVGSLGGSFISGDDSDSTLGDGSEESSGMGSSTAGGDVESAEKGPYEAEGDQAGSCGHTSVGGVLEAIAEVPFV